MRKKKGVDKKKLLAFGLAVVTIVVCLIVYLVGTAKEAAPEDSPLNVAFIDVGQGDCELLRCEDTVVLIDGGEAENGVKVERYLNQMGVSAIDCYILTHPHSDHIGAAPYLMGRFPVGAVMMTEFSELNIPTTKNYEDLLDAVAASQAEVLFVKGGENYNFGPLSLNVLAPLAETDDYNDMSVVVRAVYKNTSFLFTGDASQEVEKQILEGSPQIVSDVLKVGHHGSGSATGAAFLKAVSPEYAVISCGADNPYGHPDARTLEMLKKCGAETCRTDTDGTVLFYGDGRRLHVRTER